MLNFYGKEFSSRLLIGSALYPSPAIMQAAIRGSGANIVTVSLRREAAGGKTGDAFWSLIRELDVTVLPNTAGCKTVREAVTTAKLARELFATSWIKLEVIADNDTLQPDVVGLVEAASILTKDGFEVFPYCTEDLSVAMRLVDAGCKVSIDSDAHAPGQLEWQPYGCARAAEAAIAARVLGAGWGARTFWPAVRHDGAHPRITLPRRHTGRLGRC